MAKSLEKFPLIKPGTYVGLWSAYNVVIIFANGKTSESIKVDEGVRGVNCQCTVRVNSEGVIDVN